MKPKVLLVMTCCWVPPARLAMALIRAGCTVEAVCPRGHAIAHVRGVGHRYSYNGFLQSIRNSIRASKPDLIIPCDDYATAGLHSIGKSEAGSGDAFGVARIIEYSLGNPDSCVLITARGSFLAVAKELDIAVPETEILADVRSVRAWFSNHPFPAYMKADGTSGGVGVRRIERQEQAEQAFERLASPPGTLRTWKRALIDEDRRLVAPWLRRSRPVVSVQSVIQGQEANCAIACWQGRVLACIGVQVVERSEKHGPATVIRLVDNAEMLTAAEKIAGRLGLSGLYGLDFILEEGTGAAYLLEMNARATQTCHLALGPGRDPVSALVAAMMEPSPDAVIPESITDRDTIALFPAEWKRDPASKYLARAFHDVPWEEPALLYFCVRARLRDWISYRQWRAEKRSRPRTS
jgi:carbamoylphosphate synthase large subunit